MDAELIKLQETAQKAQKQIKQTNDEIKHYEQIQINQNESGDDAEAGESKDGSGIPGLTP